MTLPVPANAEFEVVNNIYGCGNKELLSLYRRPLPVTNLRALIEVMWDGRGSSVRSGTKPINPATNPADLVKDVRDTTTKTMSRHPRYFE